MFHVEHRTRAPEIAVERRLGRGLGALLSDGSDLDERTSRELPLDRIRPNPQQPRRHFDTEAIEELAESIRTHGILQPVVVRQVDRGYELISGERRWRAARRAGLSGIPAVIREGVGDAEMLELALVENVQREDLDPLERAQGYRSMMSTLGITQEEVASKVGLKRASVANHLRLLELPDEAQDALRRGLIDMGHARALLGLRRRGAILKLLGVVVRRELSVREVERRVREELARADGGAGARAGARRRPPAWVGEVEGRMRESLGAKVSIQNKPGYKGRVVIEYFNRKELDRICERLAPKRRV